MNEEELSAIRDYVRDFLFSTAEKRGNTEPEWHPLSHPAYRWQHTLNVTDIAVQIAEAEGDDPLLARVAGLFHDISHYVCDYKVHSYEAARIAKEYLEARNCDPEFIEQVYWTIYAHADERNFDEINKDPLSHKILIEADVIDKVSIHGVAATLMLNSSQGKSIPDCIRDLEEHVIGRADRALKIIWTETGKRMIKERQKRAIGFVRMLKEELASDLQL